MAVVAPANRPKSVRIRCIIEAFGGVCVLSLFEVFCGCKGFCHRTVSDLLLFLFNNKDNEKKISWGFKML